jgi:hypothetical protein
MARAAIGAPPSVKRKESKKRVVKPKHKPTIAKILADSDV